MLKAAALVVCLTTIGCARRVVAAHDPIPAPVSGVRATLQRQVVNAVESSSDEFLASLRSRIANTPDDIGARLSLAAYYHDRGLPDLELEHYRLAAARFPDSVDCARALASALRASGAVQQAKQVLADFCNRSSRAPAEFYSLVGILSDDDRQFVAAELWHRAACERQPDSAVLHNNLGYNLLLQGRPADAAVELRRSLDLDPRSEIARNNLGVALADNPDEAVRAWQSLAGPASAHSNMAAVLIEQKRYPEAKRELEIAFAYAPRHPEAIANWKLLAELTGGSAQPPKSGLGGRVALALRKVWAPRAASN